MPTTAASDLDRQTAERVFHDQQATMRATTFCRNPAELRFTDADYLDHETWIRPAMARFGSVHGKSVLDYGCGHGMAAVVLARLGAVVTAFDLSPGYVHEAEERAAANGVRVCFVVADGEALPFDDNSFDCVWGNAVLHHLDLVTAGAELKRVLKPGGVAVFCEPWGGNPLLEFARKHLPYPAKNRTADEQPLRPADLGPLRELFPSLTIEGFQLLSMVRRVWNNPRITSALDGLDTRCLRTASILTKWCRYVVLVMTKG